MSYVESDNCTTSIQECLNPAYKPISRKIAKSDMLAYFDSFKTKLIEDFSTLHFTIACTSDMWTGCNNLGYICITAHYIDSDWLLNKRIISFRHLEGPHNANRICKTIVDVFYKYKISDKISSVTLDNAAANTSAIEMIKRQIKPAISAHIFHDRCDCHIINLIVQKGLTYVTCSLSTIREALIFCSNSTTKYDNWKKYCKEKKIKPRKFSYDVEHRWNSTYLMLRSCLDYKDHISAYVNSHQDRFVIDDAD